MCQTHLDVRMLFLPFYAFFEKFSIYVGLARIFSTMLLIVVLHIYLGTKTMGSVQSNQTADRSGTI
jgi:hypothetical protein